MKWLAPGTHTVEVVDTFAGYVPNMSGYFAQLQYQATAAPEFGAAHPALVFSEEVSERSSRITTTFSNSVPVVLTVSGAVSALFYNSVKASNAGVRGYLTIDGEPCSDEFSFEAYSSSIRFYTNPSCIQAVLPGTHTIELKDYSAGTYGNMSEYHSRLQLQAMALQM